MGAQSDFISEQFVPDERYKARQRAMAQMLRAAGLDPSEFDSLSTYEESNHTPLLLPMPRETATEGDELEDPRET